MLLVPVLRLLIGLGCGSGRFHSVLGVAASGHGPVCGVYSACQPCYGLPDRRTPAGCLHERLSLCLSRSGIEGRLERVLHPRAVEPDVVRDLLGQPSDEVGWDWATGRRSHSGREQSDCRRLVNGVEGLERQLGNAGFCAEVVPDERSENPGPDLSLDLSGFGFEALEEEVAGVTVHRIGARPLSHASISQ